MNSLISPQSISGSLKIVEINDLEQNEDGTQKSDAMLDATITDEFADRWRDSKQIISTRVNHAVAGVYVDADTENVEFQRRRGAARARMTLPAQVLSVSGAMDFGPLSKVLTPPDSLVARAVLIDPDKEILGQKRADLLSQINREYNNVLDPDNPAISLRNLLEYIAIFKDKISPEDAKKFLFGLRRPEILNSIIKRLQVDNRLNYPLNHEETILFMLRGFTHNEVLTLVEDMEDKASLVGANIIFPGLKGSFESRFIMRLKALQDLLLDEVQLPVKFFDTSKKVISGYDGGDYRRSLESFARIDYGTLPSYQATDLIFRLLEASPGERKALLIRDEEELKRVLRGDQSRVEAFNPILHRVGVNPLHRAENPDLPEFTESIDAKSYPELQILEEAEKEEKGAMEIRDGVLFCEYFPDTSVLRNMYNYSHLLRGIVFKAPSYKRSESVINDEKGEAYPYEANIFFDHQTLLALKEFHSTFPNIPITWSHPGIERNLIFVDNGDFPMFVKPEYATYLLNPETTTKITFCGSSTIKSEQSIEEKEQKERALTQAICSFIKRKGLMPVGINGGGPDVMDRNGKHLQEFGAMSVASACDLGKVKQSRHMNWDAVLNLAGDNNTSFTLRENFVMAGDIVIIDEGGIGSIEEILFALTQNKVELSKKAIFLIGSEYWKNQVEQLIVCGKAKNLKPRHLSLIFSVDSPEEIVGILTHLYNKPEAFLKERIKYWADRIHGQVPENNVLEGA